MGHTKGVMWALGRSGECCVPLWFVLRAAQNKGLWSTWGQVDFEKGGKKTATGNLIPMLLPLQLGPLYHLNVFLLLLLFPLWSSNGGRA